MCVFLFFCFLFRLLVDLLTRYTTTAINAVTSLGNVYTQSTSIVVAERVDHPRGDRSCVHVCAFLLKFKFNDFMVRKALLPYIAISTVGIDCHKVRYICPENIVPKKTGKTGVSGK